MPLNWVPNVEPYPKISCVQISWVSLEGIQKVSAQMPGFPLTPAGNHKKNGVRGLPSGYFIAMENHHL